jgi:hypothetical protein
MAKAKHGNPLYDQLWVVGCAQSCAPDLPAVLANLERLRGLFRSSRLLVLENDSSDDTREILARHGQADPGLQALAFTGLNGRIPVKTLRLAHLRNGAMAWLRQVGAFAQEALVLVLDLDAVNAAPWDFERYREVLEWFWQKPKAAAVFANQLGPYYDLWALRHPQLCPDDIWECMLAAKLAQPALDDAALLEQVITPRQLHFEPSLAPFKVDSAFGGLGFYKTQWLAVNPLPYVGDVTRWLELQGRPQLIRWQCAEHVSFHAGLRAAGGSLWLHPGLLNWPTEALPNGLRLNPASWRHLSF